MHIAYFVSLTRKTRKQKPAYFIVRPYHFNGSIEKLRQNDKVYRNIVYSRSVGLVACVLVKQKYLALFKLDFRSIVYNMPLRARAHINYFNIIVAVLRKSYKPCIGADSEQLACLKQLLAVYKGRHIIGVHAHIKRSAAEDIFFLLGYTGKLF